ncbi:hypothetical protein EDD85DRAFT_64081 [Armillaria nabsnona]|nr:hypothetical protein EDD85DRAFT_64081 [Armillaria nabsnona]
MASQTVPVESSDGNKLIANTDEVPTALPPASPRLSVVDTLGSAGGGIPTSIESGGFSAIENRDGDVPSDAIIAEKTQDSVMESVSFVDLSTGATSMLNDASINDIASSSLSDEEEDSIANVIKDLFGEEDSEPDPALSPPSLLDLHENSPLRISPPPNAETEKDLNDRARSRSPSRHSIQSTPPRNRSASIHSASPPPRASPHDRHSIQSTPLRNPSPHPRSVSIEERELPTTPQLSSPSKTPVQTATSPATVTPASSPPPRLNYEGRGDQETNVDSIIDQDRNVFGVSSRDPLPFFDLTFDVFSETQKGNTEASSMDLETPSTTQTPPVSIVTGKRSTNLRSVSPPPPAKRVMREISPSDERAKLEALKEYNERSEELLTIVAILAKQEESLRRLSVPLPEHDPTVDNFGMHVFYVVELLIIIIIS